jgi:hypothetical protein
MSRLVVSHAFGEEWIAKELLVPREIEDQSATTVIGNFQLAH